MNYLIIKNISGGKVSTIDKVHKNMSSIYMEDEPLPNYFSLVEGSPWSWSWITYDIDFYNYSEMYI